MFVRVCACKCNTTCVRVFEFMREHTLKWFSFRSACDHLLKRTYAYVCVCMLTYE